MIVNKNGNIVNTVTNIAKSIAYQGYVAILDADGAIIQISETDIYKIYNFLIQNQQINIQHNLDSFFVEGK